MAAAFGTYFFSSARTGSCPSLPALAERPVRACFAGILAGLVMSACGGGGVEIVPDQEAPPSSQSAPQSSVHALAQVMPNNEEAMPNSTARQATGSDLDVAIDGNGALIAIDTASGAPVYTRLGQFRLNSAGRLVHHEGRLLAGRPAGTEGASADEPPQALPPVLFSFPSGATSRLKFDFTLNHTAPLALDGPFDPRMVCFPPFPTQPLRGEFCANNFVSDGGGHWVNLWFGMRRVAADPAGGKGGRWRVEVSVEGRWMPEVAFELEFGSNGLPSGRTLFSMDVPSIISADGSPTRPVPGVVIDMRTPTQRLAYYFVVDYSSEQSSAGNLTRVVMGEGGEVVAEYDNGEKRSVGRAMLAQWNGRPRLRRLGTAGWTCTDSCVAPSIVTPGTHGTGTLIPGALNLVY